MADEINVTNPSSNQILVYDETQQAFVNVEPDLSLFGNTTYIQGGMNLGQSDGEHIFNNVVSNTMRFRRIRGNDGIVLTSSGSYIDISFDGDATTLQGLGRSGFLEKGNNLSDANAQDVRNNIDVYSKGESDSSFMFANANNIPDVDATYDIGSNGRRYADMYAVTFHGLATEAVISQTIERKGAQNGDVLTWDSSEGGWVPKESSTSRLSELVDVDLNNIQHESVLVYNGIRNLWESAPLSSLGVTSGDGGTAGTITDAENVGNGIGTFFARFGGNLQFRSVTGGSNITVTTNFNDEEIVIDADVPQTTDDLPEGNNNLYFTSQRVRDTLGTVSIQDLGSVNATAPVSGQAPVWNGTEWVFTDVAANVSSTDDIPEGTNNLYYDSQRVYTDIGEYLVDINYGISLNEISDVDAIQSAGTFLYSDGTRWNNREILLSDISDVSLTGLSDGSTIVYNSGTGEFQVGQLPENLIDLGETTDSLHFNSISFDSFFTQKTTDDLSETSQNRFLNNTNLINALQNISINSLTDVDTTGVSDSNVLVWSSSQSAFVPADSSSLNVSVNMGIEDLNNVNESSVLNAQNGYGLVYNSISGEFEFTDLAQSLSTLSDVSASGIANGEVLVYQSGTFVPQGLLPYDANSAPTDGDILQFNSISGQFESVAGGNLGVENLGDLLDVTITSVSDGQIVVYDGALSQYVNKNVSDSIALASLSDVSTTGITSGQALIYDGVNFSAQDVLPYELTTPLANQILSYDDVNSRFVNTDPTAVLGIDTSNSEDGDVLVYNGTNEQYESAAWALYVSEENTPVDGEVYTLRWDQTAGEYLITPVSSNVTLESLSNVDVVDQSNGSGVFYNNSTGTFEIKKVNIQDAGDLTLTSIADGDAIVWDSGTGSFVNGKSSVSVEDLTNVSQASPNLGESIVWDGEEYVKAKVNLSYDEVVKSSTPYEFWNFNDTLAGSISGTIMNADSGYTLNFGAGVKGTSSLYSGTSYDINGGSSALTYSTTVGSFTEANANEFSYDFWYQPSTNVAYQGTPEEATVARMEIEADNLASEYINLEMVIAPSGGSFVHEIKVIKNGIESGRYPLNLNDKIFNHIAVNYRKNGTNTELDVYVNTNRQVDQTLATAIDSDLSYTVRLTLLEELETGSEAYSIDNVAVYDSVQSEDLIQRKYKNIVSNGFDFSDTDINNIDGIELTNVSIGDTLVYDGTNYVNQATPIIPENINDLGDVDTTGITSGQVLQYDGTNFVPFTITDQVGATQLSELSDVDSAISPVDGQTLVYNSTSGLFEMGVTSSVNSIEDLDNVDETVTPQDNQVLTYNSSTQKYEPRDTSSGGSQGTSVYEFTATAGQTDFSVQHDNNTMVFANGFLMPTSEIDDTTSTSTVTLNTPRNAGDTIRVLVIHDPNDTQTNPQASVTNAVDGEFTMTQGQTVITFAHSGNVMVYVNGILLATSEVDSTDPTQITLNTPRDAGDIIRIVDFVQV